MDCASCLSWCIPRKDFDAAGKAYIASTFTDHYSQGWYIITYALGIFLLNLFIQFLQPRIDPALLGNPTSLVAGAHQHYRVDDEDGEGGGLPLKQGYKLHSTTRASDSLYLRRGISPFCSPSARV